MLSFTPSGIDAIVYNEIGSWFSYNSKPEWSCPSDMGACANVGVTIGVGYDLRWEKTVSQDWSGYLPTSMIDQLNKVVGLGGAAAKAAAKSLGAAGVSVSYDTAKAQFSAKVLPRYAAMTDRSYPGLSSLTPNAQAAVTSLVYQWGSAYGPTTKGVVRRVYMPQLALAIKAGNMAEMAKIFRSMATADSTSFASRRIREAELIEKGVA